MSGLVLMAGERDEWRPCWVRSRRALRCSRPASLAWPGGRLQRAASKVQNQAQQKSAVNRKLELEDLPAPTHRRWSWSDLVGVMQWAMALRPAPPEAAKCLALQPVGCGVVTHGFCRWRNSEGLEDCAA